MLSESETLGVGGSLSLMLRSSLSAEFTSSTDAYAKTKRAFDLEKKAKPAEPGAPGWVTTFADLMSLLMCFFVMLLSMAQLDIEKFKAMAEGMSKGLGKPRVIKLQELSIEDILTQAEVIKAKQKFKTIQDADELRLLLKPEIVAEKIELEIVDRLIIIRILQDGSFSSGSADLNPGFLPVVTRIQEALAEIPGLVTVAGHTDNAPMGSGGRIRSNWELSGARAFSVVNALLKGDRLDAKRVSLTGFGDAQPIASNDTAEGRGRNRRVEIVIDQRGLTRDISEDAKTIQEKLGEDIRDDKLELERSSP